MVGLGAPDDAAVWRLDDRRALVVTTDFFTPVVDDAYDYGAIAAANALSDLYAMGARPFLALNVVCLPPSLPNKILTEIARGSADKVREAGAVVAGGHSVQDDEPKVGLVAVGMADPDHIISKAGAKAGDMLVLTKPLGIGVTATALKDQKAEAEHTVSMTAWMKLLNRAASELAIEMTVRGGTDVTGFSLLGHGAEMAQASGVKLHFYAGSVPVLAGARDYANQNLVPGGTYDNRIYFGPQTQFAEQIDDTSRLLLFDSQTSGGLLLAVSARNLGTFMTRAGKGDVPAWVVGKVEEGEGVEVSAGAVPGAPAPAGVSAWSSSFRTLTD